MINGKTCWVSATFFFSDGESTMSDISSYFKLFFGYLLTNKSKSSLKFFRCRHSFFTRKSHFPVRCQFSYQLNDIAKFYIWLPNLNRSCQIYRIPEIRPTTCVAFFFFFYAMFFLLMLKRKFPSLILYPQCCTFFSKLSLSTPHMYYFTFYYHI